MSRDLILSSSFCLCKVPHVHPMSMQVSSGFLPAPIIMLVAGMSMLNFPQLRTSV